MISSYKKPMSDLFVMRDYKLRVDSSKNFVENKFIHIFKKPYE